jgi:hypothetical protein
MTSGFERFREAAEGHPTLCLIYTYPNPPED